MPDLILAALDRQRKPGQERGREGLSIALIQEEGCMLLTPSIAGRQASWLDKLCTLELMALSFARHGISLAGAILCDHRGPFYLYVFGLCSQSEAPGLQWGSTVCSELGFTKGMPAKDGATIDVVSWLVKSAELLRSTLHNCAWGPQDRVF